MATLTRTKAGLRFHEDFSGRSAGALVDGNWSASPAGNYRVAGGGMEIFGGPPFLSTAWVPGAASAAGGVLQARIVTGAFQEMLVCARYPLAVNGSRGLALMTALNNSGTDLVYPYDHYSNQVQNLFVAGPHVAGSSSFNVPGINPDMRIKLEDCDSAASRRVWVNGVYLGAATASVAGRVGTLAVGVRNGPSSGAVLRTLVVSLFDTNTIVGRSLPPGAELRCGGFSAVAGADGVATIDVGGAYFPLGGSVEVWMGGVLLASMAAGEVWGGEEFTMGVSTYSRTASTLVSVSAQPSRALYQHRQATTSLSLTTSASALWRRAWSRCGVDPETGWETCAPDSDTGWENCATPPPGSWEA